jgi:hypothetical protein
MADDKPKKPVQGETHHYTEEELMRDQLEKQKQSDDGGDGKPAKEGGKS